ncbi:MAG: aminotransferase class V-fold PLP-dependent enzyme, partial [Pseudomonadota bacterium]
GAFGERFAEIAKVHKIEVARLQYEWGELVDANAVARILDEDPKIVAVVMCHHETSVGLLNPIHAVGKICRERDRMCFVDAISSLGAEDVDVRRDNIDVLISSSTKCLHAVSGVAFACVNKRIWPTVEGIPSRVYYLDLKHYRNGQIPFTPAVSNIMALDVALDELLQIGVKARIERYRSLNQHIRDSLRKMGFEPFTENGFESHTISTVAIPDVISFDELYATLKKQGFIVYACKERLQKKYFQIANMGELTDEMVQGFLDTLALVLRRAARSKKTVTARQASALR